MSAQILVGALAGLLLADYYKVDKLKSVLASIVLGFVNVWIFLHLTVRKQWTVGKTLVAMFIGYFLLFWAIFSVALVVGIAGQVARS